MNGCEYLARLFKERENESEIDIKIGTITALPQIKIKVGEKAVLDKRHIIAVCDLWEYEVYDGVKRYKHINKDVVLMRFDKKFIVLGVIHSEENA